MVVEAVKPFLIRVSVAQVLVVRPAWEILVQRREVGGMVVQSPFSP